MINNFDKLTDFLTFEEEGDFYYLQIIKRKKENPGLNKTEKVIKNYYIENFEYLDRKKEEIIQLCNHFNARAYLRLNKRNYKDLTYRTNLLLAKYMHSGQYRATMTIWDKVCGRFNAESGSNRKWILDFDEVETDRDKLKLGKTLYLMNMCQPEREGGHLLATLKTKTGIHAITKPFNKKEFQDRISDKRQYSEVEIHTDNPTNLYIP